MKTIGLLGGMSWESSLEYYRIINEVTHEKLGGMHSAKSLLFSFDFAEIEHLQALGDWDSATQMMVDAGQQLERGGADFIVICTNTMHKMVDAMQAVLTIPILHIAVPTVHAVKAQGLRRIALLGTRYTMEQDFYKGVLIDHGLEVIIPNDEDRQRIHAVIYDELVLGIVNEDARRDYQAIIGRLQAEGAEGVILGCTEIGLLIHPEHSPIPTFDTTQLHAEAAVTYALDM